MNTKIKIPYALTHSWQYTLHRLSPRAKTNILLWTKTTNNNMNNNRFVSCSVVLARTTSAHTLSRMCGTHRYLADCTASIVKGLGLNFKCAFICTRLLLLLLCCSCCCSSSAASLFHVATRSVAANSSL